MVCILPSRRASHRALRPTMDAAFALVQPAPSAGADASQMRIAPMRIGTLRKQRSAGDEGEKNPPHLLHPLFKTRKTGGSASLASAVAGGDARENAGGAQDAACGKPNGGG